MITELLPELTFQILRPAWLLAILPALTLFWLLRQRKGNPTGWSAVIDSELLPALLDRQAHAHQRWPLYTLLAGWVLATVAMAGPSFSKKDQTALKQADALVILLDLSPSMLAQDIRPSRLQAAHYKILDLLQQRQEGYTALIAYAGSAHVVAPLSDDSNTIAALVSSLEPRIMPSIGSQTEDAVSEALQLMENSQFNRGRLLLVTDGVVPTAAENINRQLDGKSIELHVIGVGTTAGAPIPLDNGQYIKDSSGAILINQLDEATLQALATSNQGNYHPLRTDGSDIAALVAPPAWLLQMNNGDPREASHTIEHWQDSGYWFALPCLLLALLFFRRGMLLCLLPLLLLGNPTSLEAQEQARQPSMQPEPASRWPQSWQDWWQTPDQQAAQALAEGDTATAARTFADPQWKAYAEFENGQHEEAASHFAESPTAHAHYNRGNALAHAGDLQGAITAYDQALVQQPDLQDAVHNRELVRKLLEEQQAQQEQQEQEQQQQEQKQQKNNEQQDSQDQQSQQQQQEQQQQKQQQSDSESQQTSSKPSERSKSGEKEQQQPVEEQESREQASRDEEAEEKPGSPEEKEGDTPRLSEEKQSPAQQQDKTSIDSMSRAEQEKQQATQQWLRKVPDDPGGLMKNKFEYYYQLNRQEELRQFRSGQQQKKENRW